MQLLIQEVWGKAWDSAFLTIRHPHSPRMWCCSERTTLWAVSLQEGAPYSACIYYPCPRSRVTNCPCLPRGALVLFIHLKFLFIAALGLHCFKGFSLVAESRGYPRAVASHWGGLSCCRAGAKGPTGFSGCGFRAQSTGSVALQGLVALEHCMWGLPGSEVEPVIPTLAGWLFITESPGKPLLWF